MAKKPSAFGRDLQTYSVFDFTKGLDVKASALQLAIQRGQNSLRKASNCVYTQAGAVTKRYDQTKVNTTTIGASVAITGGIQVKFSDGTSQVIFGSDDGKINKMETNGTVTAQVTGLTTGTKHFFAVFNDKLLWGNRSNAPRSYDGTTWSALAGTPPSTGGPVATFGNRVFWAESTTKSKITYSILNAENDYTGAGSGNFLVNPNDGSDVVDLVPSLNELIILKGSRPFRLQGTSPSTYALTNLVPSTGGKGAVSNQGNQFAVNDVWFLADNGVLNLRTTLQFGDLKASFASDKIAAYWEPNSGVTLSLINLSSAVSAYDGQTNRLYWAVDSDADNKNDTLLVLDLHTNGWSTWPSQSIASMWPVRNTTDGIVEIYAGGYDGFVRVLNRKISTNAFTGEARHLSALGEPGVQKSPRHVYLYMKEDGNYTVSVDTKFDFGSTGGQTYTPSVLGNSKTLGVNWTLGTDPLGSQTQIVKRLNTSGVGEFLELGVKNANAGENFTWYGYEVLWRPRRIVRPSV